jgi:hypothetical protein
MLAVIELLLSLPAIVFFRPMKLNLYLVLPALLLAGFIQGQDDGKKNVPHVAKAAYFDVTPPLRDMPIILPGERDRSWKDNIIENKSLENVHDYYYDPNIPDDFVDPVLQKNYSSSREIAGPVTNFEGVNNRNGVYPPDTDGDVGLEYYFQMINLSFAIWDKQGHLLYGPVDNSTLWNGFIGSWTGTNDGDPIVVYDELADRWMASQFAVNTDDGTYWQLIAVSSTSDPTGSYYRYAFQMPVFNDYPKLSVWPDGYYASFNMFGSYTRVGVAAFEREAMLAGNPDAQYVYFDQPDGTFSMQPADFDGTPPPDGAPCYFGYIRSSNKNFEVWEFHTDWTNPDNSTFTLGNAMATASYNSNLSGVPQPGTNTTLDDLGVMLMFRLQYRNFGAYQTLVANHTVNAGSGRTGVRWYELRKESAAWSIHQQGTYAPNDGLYRWMGSAAMNVNGDIALGFNVSGTSKYPSIHYVGRRANAAFGEMNLNEVEIFPGTGSQSGISRWGDYSCLSVDPSDDTTFWFTTEYQTNAWKTRIASFNFGPLLPPSVYCGNDTAICENVSFYADEASAQYQQTVTWHSSGTGFFIDPTDVQAVYLRSVADIDSGNVQLWMVGTGYIEGQEVSDSLLLFFNHAAKANAGLDSTICVNETIQLSGSAIYQDSVLWKSDGDGTFDDIRILNPVYTPGQGDIDRGYVYLRLTAYDSIPCVTSNTDKVKITLDPCTGINELQGNNFSLKVVPNPAKTRIDFEVRGMEDRKDMVLTMTNAQGTNVFTMKLPANGGQYSNSMDISRFPRGIYYFKAGDSQGQVIQKVILQ